MTYHRVWNESNATDVTSDALSLGEQVTFDEMIIISLGEQVTFDEMIIISTLDWILFKDAGTLKQQSLLFSLVLRA